MWEKTGRIWVRQDKDFLIFVRPNWKGISGYSFCVCFKGKLLHLEYCTGENSKEAMIEADKFFAHHFIRNSPIAITEEE